LAQFSRGGSLAVTAWGYGAIHAVAARRVGLGGVNHRSGLRVLLFGKAR